MDSWSELHISIVYYSGIFVALLTSVIILLVLSPIESVSKKIFGRLSTVWNKSFKTTLILGGLLILAQGSVFAPFIYTLF